MGLVQKRMPWQRIADLNINAIQDKNDILMLESFLPSLLNSNISAEEFNNTSKSNLLKVLQLSQLSLEYFLYTHDYLDSNIATLNQNCADMEKEIKMEVVNLEKGEKRLQLLKKEQRQKQEALKNYKKFLDSNPTFKCHLCNNKFFQSEAFLDQHMRRRHPEQLEP